MENSISEPRLVNILTPRDRFLEGCVGESIDELSIAPFLKATACEVGGTSIKTYCERGHDLADAQLKCAKRFAVDSVNVASDVLIEAESMGSISTHPENDFPRLETPALDRMGVDELPMPDVAAEGRFPVKIDAVRRLSNDEYAVVAWVMSAYQLATQLRGFKQMVVDLMKHDRGVKPLLGKCLEVSRRFAAVLVEEGADVISIGNASSSMDILSPGTYLDNLAEYDRRLSQAIRKKGALSQMHICGNIAPILGELDRMVDIVDVDHKVGVVDSVRGLRKAAMKGNMDPSLVRFRPAEEVRRRAAEIVASARKAGRSRGFVFSTGCEVPRETPHASIDAMIASAREAWKA